ncbi:MAG TPA: hypothetical protein DEP65_11665 [Ruminococcus sp.]|nr:hypothetical protein [Ruminococcus sp.]
MRVLWYNKFKFSNVLIYLQKAELAVDCKGAKKLWFLGILVIKFNTTEISDALPLLKAETSALRLWSVKI